APRAADIIDSVTTEGGRRILPMQQPFTSPASVPTPIPARMPDAVPWLLTTLAETTLTSAATEPTERSIPAVRITIVCPHATRPVEAIWRLMLARFESCVNVGFKTPKMTARVRIATGTPIVHKRT